MHAHPFCRGESLWARGPQLSFLIMLVWQSHLLPSAIMRMLSTSCRHVPCMHPVISFVAGKPLQRVAGEPLLMTSSGEWRREGCRSLFTLTPRTGLERHKFRWYLTIETYEFWWYKLSSKWFFFFFLDAFRCVCNSQSSSKVPLMDHAYTIDGSCIYHRWFQWKYM